jgi:hypothetical protein
MPSIKEWVVRPHRFAWGERYLYIKVVVIGGALFCGKVAKALVKREKLSFLSVDKPVEDVDNLWVDLTISSPSPLLLAQSSLNPARYPHKSSFIHSYPHLFHIWG